MRSLLARSALLRHPIVALPVLVVVASGAAGFASGQVAGHLLHRLAVTRPVAHQSSGQVQGSLGQRVGGTVAQQPVVRTVYVPHAATPAPTSSAHPRQSGAHGETHRKHGKHDKGGHGSDHDGHDEGGHGFDGHSGDGDAAPHGGVRHARPTDLPHQ